MRNRGWGNPDRGTESKVRLKTKIMYLGFYGLEREPFRLSPDPRFLHLAAPHRTVLEAMLHGVASRKGLQVCAGPIGTGKTTLLYCLQCILTYESTPERPVRTAFIVNPKLSGLDFYEALFDDLEVPFPGTKSRSLRVLHQTLADAYAKNGTLLIVIDEAHLLSAELLEEVRLLLNLDNYPANVLQIILCGQPELLDMLAKPALAPLRQRVSIFSQLKPLTVAESRAYIAERLRVAGLRRQSPFSDPAIEEIHRRTKGVPRSMNVLCDRVLDVGHRKGIRTLGADLINEVADDFAAFGRPGGLKETVANAKPNLVSGSFSHGNRDTSVRRNPVQQRQP